MQFTTINKLISQLLVGVLAFAVAGWLAYSYELKFAQPLGGLPASLAWSGEKGGGLTVAVSGLIALAAIASLGLVLEGLSLLYLQPLLRGVPGQKEDRVLRFFPRKEFFDNLMFWQEEFGKCVGQNNKFAQLPASIAGDPDKQRGLAVVLFLQESSKELNDWTISHFGVYYFSVALLQLIYIGFAGEFVLLVVAAPLAGNFWPLKVTMSCLPLLLPIVHASLLKFYGPDKEGMTRWRPPIIAGYVILLLLVAASFVIQSGVYPVILLAGVVCAYCILFLALDKYNYTYAMVYRFGCMHLSEVRE